jgi:ABC-type lipoprotein export system ATPase subunit
MSAPESIRPRGSEMIATVRGLAKSYATGVALRDVSFDIPRGEFVSLTGHTASGKTSVISVMEGIVKPDRGEVTIFGRNVTNMSERRLDAFKRKNIGIVYQAALIDRSFTVAENVRLMANANRQKISNRRIVEVAGLFNMVDRLFGQAGSGSGGEQMRISLMAAVAPSPGILLVDEPTSALDKGTSEAVFGMLRDVTRQEDTTVLMVTHDPVAKEYVDREIVLEQGRVLDEILYDRATSADNIIGV